MLCFSGTITCQFKLVYLGVRGPCLLFRTVKVHKVKWLFFRFLYLVILKRRVSKRPVNKYNVDFS